MDIVTVLHPEEHDEPCGFRFIVEPESRLAAILDSLLVTASPRKPPAQGTSLAMQRRVHWGDLKQCDPITAQYVMAQLHDATDGDEHARVAVIAADSFLFRLAVRAPEAPHAP